MSNISISTADMCDQHISDTQTPADVAIIHSLCEPLGLPWCSFGGKACATGIITTVRCFEDNSHVSKALAENGTNKVLVVDAGGSTRCAMLGDMLAQKAIDNDWQAIVMFGMVRDSAVLAEMPICIKALGTHPLKSVKKDIGERDSVVRFDGVTFHPGGHIYIDKDGMLISKTPLVI